MLLYAANRAHTLLAGKPRNRAKSVQSTCSLAVERKKQKHLPARYIKTLQLDWWWPAFAATVESSCPSREHCLHDYLQYLCSERQIATAKHKQHALQSPVRRSAAPRPVQICICTSIESIASASKSSNMKAAIRNKAIPWIQSAKAKGRCAYSWICHLRRSPAVALEHKSGPGVVPWKWICKKCLNFSKFCELGPFPRYIFYTKVPAAQVACDDCCDTPCLCSWAQAAPVFFCFPLLDICLAERLQCPW